MEYLSGWREILILLDRLTCLRLLLSFEDERNHKRSKEEIEERK